MHQDISEDIRNKYPGYEFTGKPFVLKDGKTYCRAFFKPLEKTHFYCFEEDFFWWEAPLNK